MTRITTNTMINNYLKNLENQRKSESNLIEQLTTQKKVNRPSDDPVAIAKILDINKRYADNVQYIRNIDHSELFMSDTESKLSEYQILLEKAHTRAMVGITDAPYDTLKLSADEIDGIREEIYRITNAQIGNDYIFSGTMTNTKPFSDNTGAGGFMANSDNMDIAIDRDHRISKNTTSNNLFFDSESNVLEDLYELSNAIRAGDKDEGLERMNRIKDYMKYANTKTGNIGIKRNTIQNTKNSIEKNSLDLRSQLTTMEDIDLAEVIIKLSQNELGLNATLSIGNKVIGQSLIEILG